MRQTFLLELIRGLPRSPERTLVLVIDAFDECGSHISRPGILGTLTDAATLAPWLKIIIISRPEADIERFFSALPKSSYLKYELPEGTTSDLRIFAEDQFNRVAKIRSLPAPWPEPSLFNTVISQAAGLFIFVKTIALALERCADPTEYLTETLRDSRATGLTSLYGLYSSILRAQICRSTAEFRRVIGVLLAAAPYRPLHDKTIAKLAGVSPMLVAKWVNELSSLLYRDDGANGGIRIRQSSVSDFFLSNDCPSAYNINFREANMDLGISCLNTMTEQLRFNICKLEDSRLTNADFRDLPSRIKDNISDDLQYSCLYWSNHVRFDAQESDERVLEGLRSFFEGPYALYWIEALSILGMVSIGVQSLQRVISVIVKVSTAPFCDKFAFKGDFNLA